MILTAEFNDEQKSVLKKINVRTDFNSDMSADEVEEYINSLKQAYLTQIKEGKKIQL